MMAMILAAGRGVRMRPLTDSIPKPLLAVAGKPLIVHQLEALVTAGVEKIIINTGYLGDKIHACLGIGERFGVSIQYSDEGNTPLETAGGIIKALPLLGDAPFIVTNADIYTNFDYKRLPRQPDFDVHLVLVDNPPHNMQGDFALIDGRLSNKGRQKLTYSGIGLYHPRLFRNRTPGHHSLVPILRQSAHTHQASGEYFGGYWNDVGTPERLQELNKQTGFI